MTAAAARVVEKAAPPAPKPRSKRLPSGHLKQMGEAFGQSVIIVPDEDFSLALIDQAYLGNEVNRLHRMDHVLVVNKSGTKETDCVAIGLDAHGALVELHVRQQWEYPRSKIGLPDLDDLYGIEDMGFADGFQVRRKSDGVVMIKNIPTWEKALQERRTLQANKLS
jgi:hypothetical protein